MSDVEKLLVVGSGGREFAIIEEALRSGVKQVYSTRAEDAINFGIEGVINTGIGEKVGSIESWANLEDMDLVIVGPEKPLVDGIGPVVRDRGVPLFGPDPDGAIFEETKVATHKLAEKYGIPSPYNSETYTPDQKEAAKAHIRELGPERSVTKRVGMEGGKGATTYSEDELEKALAEVDAVAEKGEHLLIQGRLLGSEYSPIFMLDGKGNAVATALSRDHKALLDGGLGPNTGGMGAYAPLSLEHASPERRQEIEEIGLQIADALVQEGINYRGAIYPGLMAETPSPDSPLRLLELNVRFGDPETQVLLPTLGGHAIELMYAAARGSLDTDMSRIYMHAGEGLVSLTVCLASPGYPGGEGVEIITGLPIHLRKELAADTTIQYAGAKMLWGNPVSSGGRVAYITKRAKTLKEARGVYDDIGYHNQGLEIGNDHQVLRADIGLA